MIYNRGNKSKTPQNPVTQVLLFFIVAFYYEILEKVKLLKKYFN